MKTTIDIADDLLARAKDAARREKTTLRALVEEGLRLALTKQRRSRRSKRVELVTFRGNGLRPEAQRLSWAEILEIANERQTS